jgi:hypothetical protein
MGNCDDYYLHFPEGYRIESVMSKMGDPGTLQRDLWVAGCVMRELEAARVDDYVSNQVISDVMQDGAIAIKNLSARLDIRQEDLRLVRNISWKSDDKDNMEFITRVSTYQVEALARILKTLGDIKDANSSST